MRFPQRSWDTIRVENHQILALNQAWIPKDRLVTRQNTIKEDCFPLRISASRRSKVARDEHLYNLQQEPY